MSRRGSRLDERDSGGIFRDLGAGTGEPARLNVSDWVLQSISMSSGPPQGQIGPGRAPLSLDLVKG